MEVTNNSRYYSIPLVVGRRIAQIVFFDTDGVLEGEGGTNSYSRAGKYQSSSDMAAITRNWQPSDMLPKMYCDRECIASHAASGESEDRSRTSRQKQASVEEAKEERKEQHSSITHQADRNA